MLKRRVLSTPGLQDAIERRSYNKNLTATKHPLSPSWALQERREALRHNTWHLPCPAIPRPLSGILNSANRRPGDLLVIVMIPYQKGNMIFGGHLGRILWFILILILILILMVTFGCNDSGRAGRLVGTLGTWNPLCGTQYKMLGTWYLVNCIGTWYILYSICYLQYCTLCLVLVLGRVHLTSTAWEAVSQCIRCVSLGTLCWYTVYCTWYLYIHWIKLYLVLGTCTSTAVCCIR